jgi:hypothetical protein
MLSRVERERRRRRINRQIQELLIQRRLARGLPALPVKSGQAPAPPDGAAAA